MHRRNVLFLLSGIFFGGLRAASASAQASCVDHSLWVGDVLQRMLAIKTGMTRKDLLQVFTTEGGLSTRTWRTFVSRECPYFKVRVEFKLAGRMETDAQGRQIAPEDDEDIISSISEPFLQYGITD